MIRQFFHVFWVSLRGLFRGRVPFAALLIGTPLGFTLLFGTIYAENVVNDIPLAVYDEDQSVLSRKLIQAYDDADRFTVVTYVTSEEEMRAKLMDGQALAALEIPKGFSKEIHLGNGADALLMVNSANNMFGNAALSASQEIARTFSVGMASELLEAGGVLPQAALSGAYPVRLGVRITGNPANGYASFMLSGLMLNGLQIGVMVTLAPLLITELLRRRWDRRYPSWLLAAAGTLPYLLVAFVGYLISLLAVIWLFAVPMRGSWLDAAALGLSFLVFVGGVLLVFSTCVPSRELALQAPMVYIMPGLLYSGLSWPVFDMNGVAAAFGKLLPMTYAGDALRDILLSGYAPELGQNCAIMVGGGLFCLLVASGIFHWRRMRGLRRAEEAGTCA